MKYKRTTAIEKILKMHSRIRAVAGGTSASKTISILMYLIDYAMTGNEIISVVSESMPHLRKGAMRDFLNIMEAQGYYKDSNWNKTESVYRFESGSIIEFFGVESWEKVKGARRDVLFVNEANHIDYETFTQMEIRTKSIVFIDWNPEAVFWFYTDVLNKPNVEFITLTYKDNEALDQNIIDAIESRRNNVNWFKVYGLGELGAVEGRIYKDWEVIESIPHEAKLLRYGLDFGYTNDPTAIVAEYSYNGGTIFHEILYQKGLSNRQIADVLLNVDKALVVADSAEPKSIDEIKSLGVMIVPTVKGKDSVKYGIQKIQDMKVFVTSQSTNLLKEYRSYLWLTDRQGNQTQEPSPVNNHLMDAIRYSVSSGMKMTQWKPHDVGGVKGYYPELNI